MVASTPAKDPRLQVGFSAGSSLGDFRFILPYRHLLVESLVAIIRGFKVPKRAIRSFHSKLVIATPTAFKKALARIAPCSWRSLWRANAWFAVKLRLGVAIIFVCQRTQSPKFRMSNWQKKIVHGRNGI